MSGFYVQHPRPHSAGAVSQELLKLDGDEGDRKAPLPVAKCHRSLFCSSHPGVHRIDRHTHDISWSETGETANPDLGRKRSSYSPPALHSHHQSPKYARTPDISLHTFSRPIRGIRGRMRSAAAVFYPYGTKSRYRGLASTTRPKRYTVPVCRLVEVWYIHTVYTCTIIQLRLTKRSTRNLVD
jgi:hypothetical protein